MGQYKRLWLKTETTYSFAGFLAFDRNALNGPENSQREAHRNDKLEIESSKNMFIIMINQEKNSNNHFK